MPDQSSVVCRDIIDTKTVIQNQILTTLMEKLVSTGKASRQECKETSDSLKRDVEVQMNNLVDRVLKSFQEQDQKKSARGTRR